MKVYDSHLHTKFSHDSTAEPEEIIQNAINKGLSGIAFTEHCDINFLFEEHETMKNLERSIEEAKRLNNKYGGQLKIFSGIEISESFYNKERTEAVLSSYGNKIDALLCSVHQINWGKYPEPISQYRYREFSHDDVVFSLEKYYDEELEMLEYLDGNVLCHITYPFRYVNLVHGLTSYSYTDYLPQIKKILQIAVKKEMALEVNTSNLGKYPDAFCMADKYLLEMFREYGGKLVTLGSDAHVPSAVGNCFDEAFAMIKSAGFSEYCHFEKRTPVMSEIN